jgi:hypothetical protein
MQPLELGRHIAAAFRKTGWLALTAGVLWRHPIVTGILTVAFWAGFVVDSYLDRLYSAFWYQLRKRLNGALDDRPAAKQLRVAGGC